MIVSIIKKLLRTSEGRIGANHMLEPSLVSLIPFISLSTVRTSLSIPSNMFTSGGYALISEDVTLLNIIE